MANNAAARRQLEEDELNAQAGGLGGASVASGAGTGAAGAAGGAGSARSAGQKDDDKMDVDE